MTTALQTFQFQSHPLRTEQDEHGNPQFCAKDACSILGYSNDRDAIARHCKAKGVVKRDILTDGGIQQLTFIDEGNLYRLIIKSNKPESDPFESWVCDEVLPSIRRTGQYNPALQADKQAFWVTDEEWSAAMGSGHRGSEGAACRLIAFRVTKELGDGKRAIANGSNDQLHKMIDMQNNLLEMQQQIIDALQHQLPQQQPAPLFGAVRPWTAKEDSDVDMMRAAGIGCTRIGYGLGRSADSVRNRLKRRQVKGSAQ